MLGVSCFDLGGASVRACKFTVFCVAVLAICGCDQGQPTPPAPTPDKQATTAVSAPDFAATKKAAESGNALAQTNLGLMYYNGQGVPQDYAEAMKWFRLAADQGYGAAQDNLGLMYRDSQGVPQDYVETYAWFSVAAAGGFPNAAKGRDLAASKLTPDQLTQGQKRATELLEEIGPGK